MREDEKVVTVTPFFNKILAVFFPPISVLISHGIGGKFLLNLLLTAVGWIPGVIHAFMVLPKHSEYATAQTT